MLRYDWRWLLVIVTINRVALMSRTIVIVGVMFSDLFFAPDLVIKPKTTAEIAAIMKVCTLC